MRSARTLVIMAAILSVAVSATSASARIAASPGELEARVDRTRVGPGTEIFPFASIGHRPQDLKYAGEPSELVIGANNTIREHVTMNPGTKGGGMVTRVGDGCLFMMGAHVAHDCQIGNRVIMANNSTLAGHVVVEDDAIIGGLAAVHQFVRIGRRAMVGGMSGVEHDVIPFGLKDHFTAPYNNTLIIYNQDFNIIYHRKIPLLIKS